MSDNNNHSLDKTKDKVIVGNNAHTIFEHLKSLANDPKHRQRWIWELMQNAQDANATEINITFDNKILSFAHNGNPFSEVDITHLIFHGSSKPELEGKRGKFGTGFMTTHLLSRKVNIKGDMEDGRSFDFDLTREARNDSEMAVSLNTSWDLFKESIHLEKRFDKTTFTYLQLDQEVADIVDHVLNDLPYLMPYVLVFSGKIKKVVINYNESEFAYQKINSDQPDYFKTVLFKSSSLLDEITYKMIVHQSKDLNVKLAIPLDSANNIKELPPSVPRLFLTFPLIGTDLAFPLPFLIDSEDFEPSSEREKLWLSAESKTSQTIKNKTLLESAFREYILFCEEILKLNIGEVQLLANFGFFKSIDWVDPDWYKQLMNNLFEKLDNLALVTVSKKDNEKISLAKAYIPFSEVNKIEIHKKTWELCDFLFPYKIPITEDSIFWQDALLKRMSYSSLTSHESSFTLQNICKYINDVSENKLLSLELDGIGNIQFIQSLVDYLEQFNLEKYWNEYAILPDQNGIFKKSVNLKQELLRADQEITNALKDIAESLNIPVRSFLLHEDILINSEDHKLPHYEKDTLIFTLVSNVKKLEINDMSIGYQKASINLLGWLMKNERWNELTGYPVKMHNLKWDKLQPSKEPFLVPISQWKANFQKYSDLFPPDFILHEENSFMLNDLSVMENANKKSFILTSPLYLDKDEINTNEIQTLITRRVDKDKLSKHENTEWELVNSFEFSKIAFFTTPKDKNVIDRVRGSKIKTGQLLEFITEILISEDLYGFKRKDIEVKGGEITENIGIYPSLWLKDIKNREWVKNPLSNANRPTVESLLPYFSFKEGDDNTLYRSLERQDVSRLLHFLEIGVGDLLRNIRAGNNEEERINWDQSYVSILMNKDLTPEKVKGLLGDSAFLRAYEDKLYIDKQKQINQEIGTAVEKAFEKVFESLSGYKIRREPIGSDYIIEFDFPHYLLLEQDEKNKFIIEIKSSRSFEVRMTQKQGDTAYDAKGNYILCVVPLDNDVIDENVIIQNSRFVTNISELLSSRVERVRQISGLQNEVTSEVILDGIATSIEGTNIRYVINQQHWDLNKETVLDFTNFIKEFA